MDLVLLKSFEGTEVRFSVHSDTDAEKSLSVREEIRGHIAEPWKIPTLTGINRG